MDSPIIVNRQLTKKDLYWHFLYHCWRTLPLRLTCLLLGGVLVFIALQLYFKNSTSWQALLIGIPIGILAGMLFMFLIDFIIYYILTFHVWKKRLRQALGTPTKLTFEADRLYVAHEEGGGFQKYTSFLGVFLYKRHIVLTIAPNLFQTIPWDEVPKDRQNELRTLLVGVKEKLKAEKKRAL